jgi:hypothetical protein
VTGWTWAVGPWRPGASSKALWTARGGGPLAELATATGRRLRCKLSEPSEASFTLPGGDDTAGLVEDLITDLWVYRAGTVGAVFRGRIMGPDSDTFDAGQGHTVAFAAQDYRGVLDRRLAMADRTWTGIEQSTIAWDVITDMQGQVGGDYGLIKGTWPTTGVTRPSVIVKAGDQVWSGPLKKLAGMEGGFDFDIDGDLVANLYYPGRGVDNGVVLDYGGMVAGGTRTFDPSTFGNAIRQSGADAIAITTAAVPDLASTPEGRWDVQFSDPQLTTADMVAKTAAANLATASQPTPGWTLKLARGRWGGPGHVWLGDWVTVVVKTGRLGDVFTARVTQVDIDLGDGGAEDVTVYAGTPIPDRRTVLRGIGRRLQVLAKR